MIVRHRLRALTPNTFTHSLPDRVIAFRLAVMPAKARYFQAVRVVREAVRPQQQHRIDKAALQLKFDDYRAIAFKSGGKIHLRSRP
jgi:ATP-dependent DNA ligase